MNFIKTQGSSKILELNLSVLVFQEEAHFIAFCPALNLSSYGNSIEDAKEGFNEVMTAYIEDVQRMNTLSDDLIRNGWIFNDLHDNIQPPEHIDLNIPAGLLKQQFNQRYNIPVC